MKVLIVDDEPAARAKLRRLLTAEADVAELLEAPDAPTALALVQTLPAPPDLALLDIEMPGGNGVQLAAHAMGDRALNRVVDVLGDEEPWLTGVPSVRLEHATLVSDDFLTRLTGARMSFGVATSIRKATSQSAS